MLLANSRLTNTGPPLSQITEQIFNQHGVDFIWGTGLEVCREYIQAQCFQTPSTFLEVNLDVPACLI